MDNYEYKSVFNNIEKLYNQNKDYKMPENESTELLKNSIINDDLELIELLVSKDIKINESILDILPYSGEKKFFLIVDYINKKLKDFNWGDHEEFLSKLVESNTSTVKMWSFLIETLNWSVPDSMFDMPTLFAICLHQKEDLLLWFISNTKVDLYEEYLGKNLLSYIEERMNPKTYFKVINL